MTIHEYEKSEMEKAIDSLVAPLEEVALEAMNCGDAAVVVETPETDETDKLEEHLESDDPELSKVPETPDASEVRTLTISSGDELEVVPSGTEAGEEAAIVDRHADGRPIIYVRPGSLQQIMRDAEAHLAGTGHHFQRGGAIVTVRTDPATGETSVQDLNPQSLMHALDGVSVWMRFDKRGNTWTQVDPPSHICNLMIKMSQFDRLPVLKGIARQPHLRPDGSLCRASGYDAATGLFGVFDAEAFEVPDAPTLEQAERALELLSDLLCEFPFATPGDRSAALSAMLSAAIRPSLALAPLFHVRAPQIASGKSYLCALIGALATPQKGTPVGFPGRDEECSKLLLAQLIRSPGVIEFDNLTEDLKAHKSLCTALTSERMEGRILGRTKVATVDTRVLFLSSGNNVGPAADMTRRCLTIQLDPSCEVPASRTFRRPHLIAEVQRERDRYVSAAITVIRAWIVSGCPETPCAQVASFSEWSALCRQPLMWLGQPDPAKAIFEAMAEDPERELLGRVLTGWDELCGSAALRVSDVLSRLATGRPGAEDFTDALIEVAGDRERVNTRKLGRWISRNAGRVVSGRRLVRAPKTRNVESWRVESVRSVESVAP